MLVSLRSEGFIACLSEAVLTCVWQPSLYGLETLSGCEEIACLSLWSVKTQVKKGASSNLRFAIEHDSSGQLGQKEQSRGFGFFFPPNF